MRKNISLLLAISFVILIVFLAIFAPILSPYEPDEIIALGPEPPSSKHFFGTDDLGRDIFSRILHGSRISLTVGLVAISIALFIGTLLGSFSGYYGGLLDSFIMRSADIFLSFPTIFLILAIQSLLSPNVYNVMVVIGLTSWMGISRLVRAEFLKIKELSYVQAARALGCSDPRIIFLHILPNARTPIIVAATLGVAGAILTESALSFLGLGVQPPMPSWGNMLMDAQAYLSDAPWMAIFPGIFILLTVLSLYFIGEWIRLKNV